VSFFQPPYWKKDKRYWKKLFPFVAQPYSGKVAKAFLKIPIGFGVRRRKRVGYITP